MLQLNQEEVSTNMLKMSKDTKQVHVKKEQQLTLNFSFSSRFYFLGQNTQT